MSCEYIKDDQYHEKNWIAWYRAHLSIHHAYVHDSPIYFYLQRGLNIKLQIHYQNYSHAASNSALIFSSDTALDPVGVCACTQTKHIYHASL